MAQHRTNGLIARSRRHLRDAGETYREHLRFAFGVGGAMVAAGLACILHGLVPALHTRTASGTIRRLVRVMDERRLILAPEAGPDTVPLALLLPLSTAIALIPWLAGANAVLALPMSLLALAIPAAALAAEATEEPDPALA